ncbi:MAG: restriction endonuclease subunit S [Xanthomonadales bacterium]|nr:restriction endonuclease subunit S [Xanthomonadales bacterium]
MKEPSHAYASTVSGPLIPLGYKRTEVGVIPEDWEVRPLHSLISKGRLGGNYANQNADADFPLMKMGNIARGHFDMSKVEFIFAGLTPDSQHRLYCGDVLFNTRNTLELVGKVAIWRGELPVAYYNSNLMRLEFDAGQICSNEYANYALNTVGSVARLRALATGTTSVAAIYTRDLLEFHLAVPPKSEQRAIATALSDVDALLGGLDRLIAKKRDLKQAAMQQLLTGQTRLPGFSGEWEVKRLGDLGSFLKGSGVRKDQAQSGELPCIRYGEIYTQHNDYIRSFQSRIAPEVAVSATRLKKGDLLFAGSGETKEEIGKCVAFIDDFEAYAGGDIVILRPAAVDPVFMGYYLNTSPISAQKASKGQGDAVVHISATALSSVMARIPPLPEQTAIAQILSDMDAELAALETRREKTRELKQAMMQELLTGRIRLVSGVQDEQ